MVMPNTNANANDRAVEIQRSRLASMVENREMTRDDANRIKETIRAYTVANHRLNSIVFKLRLIELVNDELSAIHTINPYSFS